jgi:hypothetical protein
VRRKRLSPSTSEYRPGIEFRIIVALLFSAFIIVMLLLAWLGGTI